MKNVLCTIAFLTLILSLGTTALAGSVPEDIFADDALLFFGEVLSYDAETGGITVQPTQKIKGDVQAGAEQTYKRGVFTWNEVFAPEGEPSDFPVEGEIYLMAYFDVNNPLHVLRVTSTDTKTLEIVGIDTANMFGRMQTYLNDGTYAHKEAERLELLAAQPAKYSPSPTSDEMIPTQLALAAQPPIAEDASNGTRYWAFGLSATALGLCGVLLLVKKRKMEE